MKQNWVNLVVGLYKEKGSDQLVVRVNSYNEGAGP